MTTLNQYLEDIAVTVLRPLGYLYAKQGATEGQYGYSGVHPDTDSHIRDNWQYRASVLVYEQYIDTMPGMAKMDALTACYLLYWAVDEVTGQQASWWVKQ